MARKNGCPMSVRDWVVEILSRAATREEPVWLAIRGLNSITLALEAETEDGSAADSLWAEPYVVKRSGKLTLEGKPACTPRTDAKDPGQAELNYFAALGGCAGDASLRLTDPYGRAQIIDVVVTGVETGSEDDGETIRWDCEIVGSPEEVAYVQLESIAPDPAEVSLAVNETRTVSVTFTPESASNRRYSVASADASIVRVGEAEADSFTITGVQASSEPVRVVLRSMNNGLMAELPVTVV